MALRWTMREDCVLISLCHGPAAFLSLRQGDNPLRGYSVCAFPESTDKETPSRECTWPTGRKRVATPVREDMREEDCNFSYNTQPISAIYRPPCTVVTKANTSPLK